MTPKRIAIFGIVCICISFASATLPYLPFGGGSIPWVEREKHPGATLVIVEESGDRDNETAIFARNTTYHALLGARGLKWAIYDDDSPNATIYRDAAQQAGVGLPAIVFVSATRQVLDVRKWPVADLDAAVKEVTGL